MSASDEGQLAFFAPVEPAPPRAELRALADALPPRVHLGTSSWTFPGWRGLVWAGRPDARALARSGLAAYARHPLLTAVGVDRTLYAPMSARALAEYRAAVPDTFRFLVKAPEALVTARFPDRARHGALRGLTSPHFLEPAWARDVVVGPFVEGLGPSAGAIVLQLPPQDLALVGGADRLIDRLHRLLSALPRQPLLAVELREPKLLTARYRDALADTGAVHCVNLHPSMPDPWRQHEVCFTPGTRALVARWLLRRGLDYETAKARYQPFDRLLDPDVDSRRALARLIAWYARSGRPCLVTVNNKAEGSAPLSIERLAAELAAPTS
jgi:uncharacterized protein YecE (DUF72 family)